MRCFFRFDYHGDKAPKHFDQHVSKMTKQLFISVTLAKTKKLCGNVNEMFWVNSYRFANVQ